MITEVELGPNGQMRPTDSVKGVNLTRVVDGTEDASYTAAARELIATAAPSPCPYEIAYNIGGPVQQQQPIATYFVSDHFVRTLAPGSALMSEVHRVQQLPPKTLMVGRLGPILELAGLEAEAHCSGGGEEVGSGGERGAGGGKGGDGGGEGGAPTTPRTPPPRVTVFCGHAVWDRAQLMGEIARRSWGIIPQAGGHILSWATFQPGPAQLDPGPSMGPADGDATPPTGAGEAEGRGLWGRLTASGEVLLCRDNPVAQEFGQRRGLLESALRGDTTFTSLPSVDVGGQADVGTQVTSSFPPPPPPPA